MFRTPSHERFKRRKFHNILRSVFEQPDVVLRAVKPIAAGDTIKFLRDPHSVSATKHAARKEKQLATADGTAPVRNGTLGRALELQCECKLEVCQYHVVCLCGTYEDDGVPASSVKRIHHCPWPACMHDEAAHVAAPYHAAAVSVEPAAAPVVAAVAPVAPLSAGPVSAPTGGAMQ